MLSLAPVVVAILSLSVQCSSLESASRSSLPSRGDAIKGRRRLAAGAYGSTSAGGENLEKKPKSSKSSSKRDSLKKSSKSSKSSSSRGKGGEVGDVADLGEFESFGGSEVSGEVGSGGEVAGSEVVGEDGNGGEVVAGSEVVGEVGNSGDAAQVGQNSDNTEAAPGVGNNGDDAQVGQNSDNTETAPTLAPTCLECDDIEAYQARSSFSLHAHKNSNESSASSTESESMLEETSSRAFLAIGITFIVLGFAGFSYWLRRQKQKPFRQAVSHEEEASGMKFSDCDATVVCDENDEEEHWNDLTSTSPSVLVLHD